MENLAKTKITSFASFVDKNFGGGISTVVNKMKGAILQYSEIQMKVDAATNNDKWCAGSSIMQEISQGTHRIDQFHEIMDMIYLKMQEKDANWRQCYKALQLLEYLIKNGSEKVVDNAKEHMYDLKALLKFRFTDDKGKDQGINIQTRAQEIIKLLGDDTRIAEERQKAKENKGKYAGFSSDSYQGGSNSKSFAGYGNQDFSSSNTSEKYSKSNTYSGSNGYSNSDGYSSSNTYSNAYSVPNEKTTGSSHSLQNGSNSALSSAAVFSGSTQAAKPPVVNLIDMTGDDDWGDFAAATAPPTSQNKPAINASYSSSNAYASNQNAYSNTATAASKNSNLIDLL